MNYHQRKLSACCRSPDRESAPPKSLDFSRRLAVETQITKIEAAHDNCRSHDQGNCDAQLFYVDNLVRKRLSYSGRRRLSYSGDVITVGQPPAAEVFGRERARDGLRERPRRCGARATRQRSRF
jgi:hypothetical protein